MATDVNSLFRTCGIEDIKIVERKIRGEIEKKKEELRLMVGERYRDLINAADTISDMRNGTDEISSGIASVGDLCSGFHSLNQQNNEEEKSSRLSNQAFYTLATQMDLLVDTPEQIWSALDMHQYLSAARLYMLSQHIVHSSLNIQSGTSKRSGKQDVYHSFPILHHQWAAISHFKPSILKGGRTALKDSTLPDKSVAESLCCISLLDNLSPRQVFTEFVMARKSAVQDVFHPSMHSASVKKQICDITHIIRLTLKQMVVLFYSTEEQEKSDTKPLFYEMLHDVTAEKTNDSPRAIQSLFGSDVDVLTVSRYLPPSVTAFVPKLRSVPVSISISYIQKHAVEWLNGCMKDIQKGVKNLLSFVNNIKGLAAIRDAVYDLLQTKEDQQNDTESASISWDGCCQICLNRSLSVWDEIFRPLFMERAKIVIEKHMGNCFANLNNSLLDVLQSLSEVGHNFEELEWDQNISSFLWYEFPQDFSNILNATEEMEEDLLSLKVKYLTPSIKRLCSQFNNHLNVLLLDVRYLICEDDADNDLNDQDRKLRAIKNDVQKLIFDSEDGYNYVIPEPFAKYGDADHIKSLVSSLCCNEIKSLCETVNNKMIHVENQINSKDGKNPLDVTADINKITFLSRFCLAIPELCYNIEKTVNFETTSKKQPQLKRQLSYQMIRKGVIKKHENLIHIENMLGEQTQHGFKIWSEWICSVCRGSIRETLASTNTLTIFGHTNWEAVEIEEENEKGEKFKSKIRVPSQISFYLSTLLHSVIEEFHRIGGAVVDQQSIATLSVNLGRCIIETHRDYVEQFERKQKMYQNNALQMVFDIKFSLKLLGGVTGNKGDESSQLKEEGHILIEKLESFVDPFDLDVFAPHLNAFVQRQVQRSWLIFGSISSGEKHIAPSRLSSATHEDHSVVQLVPNPPRFMLLPVSVHRKDEEYIDLEMPNYADEFTSPLLLNQNNLNTDFLKSMVY